MTFMWFRPEDPDDGADQRIRRTVRGDASRTHAGGGLDLGPGARPARRLGGASEMNAQREQITPSHPIRAIMAAPVVTVDGRASLRSLAETLTSHHIGALVVTDQDEPVGIASERDVVTALAEGGDPDEVWAEDVIAIHTLWGDPDDTISQAAQYMRQAEVRHVPVSHDGDVLGIVSIRDILDVLLTATGVPDETGRPGGERG